MGSASGPIGRSGRIDARFFDDAATVARAEQGLRRLLPGLAGARVERAWGGPIDVSSDQLLFWAVVCYASAMLGYAAEFAFNRRAATSGSSQSLSTRLSNPSPSRIDNRCTV